MSAQIVSLIYDGVSIDVAIASLITPAMIIVLIYLCSSTFR